jgi:hypothetical protein
MKAKAMTVNFALFVWLVFGISISVAWSQSWVPQGPIPRTGHSAVLDTRTNRMIVFGGNVNTSNAQPVIDLNDVWRLDNAGSANQSWVQVKSDGTPPAARTGHSAVYDPKSNRMIVFGGGLGQASPCANDTWVLTNANGFGGTPTWIQLIPSGPLPPPRLVFAAAYDSKTDSMIIFGGNDCFSTLFNDVWVLSNANGVSGTPTWTQLQPAGVAPLAREFPAVVYDSINNRLTVFGGGTTTSTSGYMNDVWVLENANGTGGTPAWIELSPTGGPPSPRGGPTGVYDEINNRMTVFGGVSASDSFLNEVWVLSDANGVGSPAWTELGPFETFAQARSGHSAVYSPVRNEMVVFGGVISAGPSGVTDINDIWTLTHANGL